MAEPKKQSGEFAARRKRFLQQIKGAVAIFPSASAPIRNYDTAYPFRQDSNFYYLTGFEEQSALCLFDPQSKSPFKMFVLPKDRTKELWEGYLHGPELVVEKFGADEAFPSQPPSIFEEHLIEAMRSADRIYYALGQDHERDRWILETLKRAMRKLGRTGRPFWPILDPNTVLGEMRLIKSDKELSLLRKACAISAAAHVTAMARTSPGTWEYELDGLLYHEFRAGGAARLGYNSIVASGPNACVLHYTNNDRRAEDGELMLIDAGAEYGYYSADITRTYPVNGKFTAAQKEVYEAVLDAQKQCVEAVKPGATVSGLKDLAAEVLTEHLIHLKALSGTKKALVKTGAYHEFFPHNIGHWLGMDVHDVGRYYIDSYDEHRPLEPGMVLTIEPGLYFRTGPQRLRGIGVRIEDDVVVTAKGHEVLTHGVPKETAEIEAVCSSQK